MATNYGLCIVIASLSIVTVMVRGCAWCRNWGNWQPGRLGMLRRLESRSTFIAMNISFCGIPLTLLGICAAGLCECVDEVVEIDAVHTVVRIQLG